MGVDLCRRHAEMQALVFGPNPDPQAAEALAREIGAANDYLSDSYGGLEQMMALGIAFGWEPTGTELDDPDWDGGYLASDGAEVSDDDARAFADALTRALQRPDSWGSLVCEEGAGGTADVQARVWDYIRFLRRGRFQIL